MSAGKLAVLAARTHGDTVISEDKRRCLAVATRAGSGGCVRWLERMVVRKCGEGAGRPEAVRAADSCVEFITIFVVVGIG